MNERQPSAKAQFSALLSRFSPEIVAFAKRCMPKLRRAIPRSNELVYEYNHSVVVGYGLSEHGHEAIAALAIYPQWIRLYFHGGKFLPDPESRLQGAAGVRYVTLEAVKDIDDPYIKALFKAAIGRSGVKVPRTGSGRMIIKSVAKKKAKKKPKKKSSR